MMLISTFGGTLFLAAIVVLISLVVLILCVKGFYLEASFVVLWYVANCVFAGIFDKDRSGWL